MTGLLPDNASDLRALYRLSEARSARLRLLFDTARDLATAEDERVDQQLGLASERAAHFLGFAHGRLTLAPPEGLDRTARVFELALPPRRTPYGYLVLEGPSGAIFHQDDLDSVSVLGQLIAARLASVRRDEERDRLLIELADREARLTTIVERIIVDDERARRRLAADLHDGVAQVAGAALRRLEIVDELRAELPVGVMRELDRGLDLVKQTVRELRSLIQGLRPATLETLGLAAALQEELPRIVDVPVNVRIGGMKEQRLAPDVEMALFRVAQEAVHNVRKHARDCAKVDACLELSPSATRLVISNDGDRVDPLDLHPKQASTGLGLLMMRERIAALGGDIDVSPGVEGGLTITVELADTALAAAAR